jgi:hypothetical protein
MAVLLFRHTFLGTSVLNSEFGIWHCGCAALPDFCLEMHPFLTSFAMFGAQKGVRFREVVSGSSLFFNPLPKKM